MPQLKAEEIRNMPPEERANLLKTQQDEYLMERSYRAQNKPHHQIKNYRKNIARIKTIMHENGEI